jgi:hypothetical protein
MRLDLQRLHSFSGGLELHTFLEETMAQSENDSIEVAPLIRNSTEAMPFLDYMKERIKHDNPDKYILRCVCGERGEDIKPGDIIKRPFKRPLSREGGHRPIMSNELNNWKADGEYEQNRYYYKKYVVDEKGCIKVNFFDAEFFLRMFGYDTRTRRSVSIQHKRKESNEPVDYVVDGVYQGMKKHVHYRRFEEQNNAQYEKLPVWTEKKNKGSK